MTLFKKSTGGRPTVRRRSFMAQPYKHAATGIYQLRRKVPAALRAALGREFKRSLETRDPQEAKARFAAKWAESEQAFALGTSASLQPMTETTEREALRLTAADA